VTRAHYDVVVAGGGHNGLVCGAYLAKAGLRTLILERRPLVGGAAVTEEPWPGFHVSTASYVTSLMQPKIVRDLRLRSFGYEVFPLDPAYFTPFPDGRSVLMWDQPEKAAAEIARINEADGAAYLQYTIDLDRLAAFVRPLLLRVPISLPPSSIDDLREAGFLAKHVMRHRRTLSDVVDLMTMSVADFLDRYFVDESVKGALCPGGVIGMWGGPMSPGSAYVLLHHRMGEAGGIRGAWGFVKGGMGALSEAIASAARAAGAEIRLESPVARIRAIQGRTVGVELEDGTEISARAVASGIHPTTTFMDLVGGEHLPADLVRDIERYRTRGSSAKVNLALSELPDFRAMPGTELGPQHPEFILSPSIDYVERAWDDAKHGRPSERPMLDCVIPTTVDDSIAPRGSHILTAFVQYAPPELADGRTWDQERDALGDRVIDTISEYAPNFKASVVHREVLTPFDLEQRFGLLGGNIFQGEMALDQLYSLRPAPQAGAYRTPLRGLYLCGSGSHPGGGVMGAPGHNAAGVMIKDLRR
jgi:phytoene dehydrogenase-like protein